MRAVMLGTAGALATLAISASPAAAEHWSDPGFVAAAAVTVHRGNGLVGMSHNGPDRRHTIQPERDRPDRDDRRRDRGRDVGYVTSIYGGDWALNNNRSWEPSSYNDWWHDRPDRSFPRWMQGNQDCQRQWWGGGAWRC